MQIVDVPYPWQLPSEARGELGGTTEEEFKETIEEARIGVKYFKDRKKIAIEYKRRLEKLIAIKEPKTFREPKKKRNKNLKSMLYIYNSHKMYY